MSDQMHLFTTRSPLRESFLKFHKANPHVYDALVALALAKVERCYRRGSINQLYEVLRYRWDLKTTPGDDGLKLNNNHRPYYARLIMEDEPTLAGWFETRKVG